MRNSSLQAEWWNATILAHLYLYLYSSSVEEIAEKRGISMAQVTLAWETSKSSECSVFHEIAIHKT